MAKKGKMDKKWWIAIIPGIIAIAVIVFIFALFVIKLLWVWIIPDLFPGAVAQGLIVESIGWYTAFKIAIVIGLLSIPFSGSRAWKKEK